MVNNIGEHHKHLRKRFHFKKHNQNTHLVKNYDKFIYLVGIVIPLITSSQVFKIWLNQNAQGVSLIAWSAYLFNSIAWFIYGIIHKEKPIILTNFICIIINFMVILGTLVY